MRNCSVANSDYFSRNLATLGNWVTLMWPSSPILGWLTVWKFHDFSITQILRDINFWILEFQKFAIFTHSEALNFDFHEFLHLLKAETYQIAQFRAPKMAKMAFFELLHSTKLISRKIWVIENAEISTLCNMNLKIPKFMNYSKLATLMICQEQWALVPPSLINYGTASWHRRSRRSRLHNWIICSLFSDIPPPELQRRTLLLAYSYN